VYYETTQKELSFLGGDVIDYIFVETFHSHQVRHNFQFLLLYLALI